jgi:DNA-binding Lrp family transcriptional regulator
MWIIKKKLVKFCRGTPKSRKIARMDRTDKKILATLQIDGRISITDLADRVGLSVSPCHRRVKALEAEGAIAGYHAELDADALGLTFEALIFVTMTSASRDTLDAFENAVSGMPNIIQVQRLFGDPDYLMRAITPDRPAFLALYDSKLAALPGVQRLVSTLVMKSVVERKPLPL